MTIYERASTSCVLWTKCQNNRDFEGLATSTFAIMSAMYFVIVGIITGPSSLDGIPNAVLANNGCNAWVLIDYHVEDIKASIMLCEWLFLPQYGVDFTD